MAKLLRVGEGLALPALEAQTQTIVVYGGKGMGKTNFGSVYVEELDRNGLRFSWLDPVGVAWGLKHTADGKGPGIEVLILGGIHGDLPLEPTGGAVVADLVVDEEVSVIIDISRHGSGRMWGAGEKIRFVRDYCVRLFERQGERRRPLLQVLDEAGRFVPQQMPKGAIDIAECVGAIEQLTELGRNVGVGVLLITQRSARMNKSVSELAEMMVAFRTVGPRSIDAIMDWFGDHVPRGRANELVERLRQLPMGTALVVSPGWLGLEGEYPMRARQTFDSSATPTAGAERRPSGKGAVVDHEKYRQRMTETIEKAEAQDPRALQRQVAELRKEKATLQKQLTDRPAEAVVEEKIVEVQVPLLEQPLVTRLEVALQSLVDVAGEIDTSALAACEALGGAQRLVDVARGRTEAVTARRIPQVPASSRQLSRAPEPRQHRGTARATRRAAPPPPADGDVHVKAGARRMVEVLARFHPERLNKAQLATLADVKRGGTFSDYLRSVFEAGLVDEDRDGSLGVTDAGLAFTGVTPGDVMTTEEILAIWRPKLKAGARRMLDVVLDRYPAGVDSAELGELAEVARGGTFSDYVRSLTSAGLAEKRGHEVRASDTLFLATRQ